jgi:hypothetical protein
MRLATTALTIALVSALATSALFLLARHSSSPSRVLSARDAQKVSVFEANLRATTSLDDRTSGPTYGDFMRSLDSVIAVARSNPGALYRHRHGGTQTLRRVLLEAVWRLGSFEPDLSEKLVRALEETEG